MKIKIYRFLSILFVLGLLVPLATVLTGAAEPGIPNEAEEKEEILRIGKEADMFADFLCCMFYRVSHDEDITGHSLTADSYEFKFKEFGVKKGYMNEKVGERIWVPVDPGPMGIGPTEEDFFPYADRMNSYEAWEKEVKSYFLTDFLQLVAPNAFNQQEQFTSRTKLIELNGKTYGQLAYNGEGLAHIDWDMAKFVELTETSAKVEVGMYCYDCGDNRIYGKNRYVTFAKISEGWRVSGGSAFHTAFSISYDALFYDPYTREPSQTRVQEAELLARFLTGIPYAQIESKTGMDREKLIAQYEEEYAPLIEKDYVSFENVRLAKTPASGDSFLYFELPENMNTKENWEKAIGEYFLEDSFGLLDRLVYKGGKWVLAVNRRAEVLTPVWDTFRYGNAEPGQEIVIVDAGDSAGNVSEEHKGLNFEFIMTEKGWLVKDSTYLRALLSANPPDAGDSTAPYLTLAALSLFSLTLAGAAAMVRKRREAL